MKILANVLPILYFVTEHSMWNLNWLYGMGCKNEYLEKSFPALFSEKQTRRYQL
jgi:hypothetical protein